MLRMMMIVALGAGCVSSNSEECGDGVTCPEGTTCRRVVLTTGAMENYCAREDQLGECTDDGTGATCAGGTGTCHEGVCITSACGNLLLDTDEPCDDGNTVPQDGCAADCRSNESCGNRFIDSSVGEQCDEGPDMLDHDGCTSTCQRETLTWRNVARPGRYYAPLVYDPARKRIVMFGGVFGSNESTDTWEWDGERWELRDTPIRPANRRYHRLAYDAQRGEIVMFGGQFDELSTWTLGSSGWRVRDVTASPSGRRSPGLVYDAANQRVVLFGGMNKNDTWVWNGSDWSALTTTGAPPAASQGPAMAYDAKRAVIVAFVDGETWELVGTTWTRKATTGPMTANAQPPELAFDPVSERVFLVGGYLQSGDNNTWAWNGTAWTRLADAPVSAVDHGLATGADRLVLHADARTYEWTGTAWLEVSDGLTEPDHRMDGHIATDPVRREIVLFGGRSSVLLGDTWEWNGTWTEHTGAGPSARDSGVIAFDAVRDGVVLFGGFGGTDLDDTWLWKNNTWTLQPSTVRPAPRYSASMAFSRGLGKLVLFGGTDENGTYFNDTWTWDGQWHLESPATSPPGRYRATMAYDPIRDRIVLYGGSTSVQGGDTWEYDGVTWTPVASATNPPPRFGAQLVWNANARTMFLLGGVAENIQTSEIWAFSGAWELLPTNSDPPKDLGFNLVPALDGSGILAMASGQPGQITSKFDGIWRLRWDSGSADETCIDVDTDGDAAVGCMDPDCFDVCTPLCPPATSCP